VYTLYINRGNVKGAEKGRCSYVQERKTRRMYYPIILKLEDAERNYYVRSG
jgi:hypothetical protein